MGFLDNFFKSKAAGDTDPFDKAQWTPFSLTRTGTNNKSLMSSEENWVYVCVDRIASTLAGINIRLMKSTAKGEEEVEDHEVLKLLYKPNPFISGTDFLYYIHGHRELTGDAYLRKVFDIGNKQLYPIPPSRIKPILKDDYTGIEKYKLTKTGGSEEDVAVEDIYHFRYPNLQNIFEGASVVSKIRDWVDVDRFATTYNRLFFENGSSVGAVLETEATTKAELELAKDGFEMKHRGLNNSHNTSVLPNGVKYKGTANFRDMEFEKLDTKYRDKILSAFGVPKSVLGITESGMSRADAEAKNFVYTFFTIRPKMVQFIAFLNEQVLPDFDNTGDLYFTFDDPVPENDAQKLEEVKVGIQGIMTLNEAREMLDLDPVEDGDVIMQRPQFQPVQVNSLKKKEVSPNKRKAFKSPELADILAEAVEGAQAFTNKQEKEHEARWKELINRTDPYEARVKEAFIHFNNGQKRRALKELKEIMGQKGYKGKYDVLDTKAEIGITIDFLSDILGEQFAVEGEAQMLTTNPLQTFDPNSDDAKEYLDKYTYDTAESYNKTTAEVLKNEIQDGISEGETYAKIAERISEVYNYSNETRAQMTARTATMATANAAGQHAYEQSGIVKTIKWYTAQDYRTCEFCGPLHGKEIGLQETFFNEGDVYTVQTPEGKTRTIEMKFGDVPFPPLHPNCRCTQVAGEIDFKKLQAMSTKHQTEEVLKDILEDAKEIAYGDDQ